MAASHTYAVRRKVFQRTLLTLSRCTVIMNLKEEVLYQ